MLDASKHAARRENAPLSEDAEQSAESNRDSRQTSAQPLHSLCLRGEWDTQRTNLGRKTSVPLDICPDLASAIYHHSIYSYTRSFPSFVTFTPLTIIQRYP